MSQADFWQHKESAEANRQLHAGATCALLPKKHQAAWHRPDNPKRSTGDTGAKSFSSKKQIEWRLSGNTAGTELRLGGNAAERRGRGTGVGQSNTKDWNQSTVINEDSRIFPERKMERLLSNFQAIPQYEYNFRAEKLPKAEIKGAPTYDKFHLDVSNGKAASLQKSTRAFSGFSEADVGAINGAMSYTTKTELPVHPDLASTTNIHNQGGPGDWRVSTEVLKSERDAALEKLDAQAAVTSKTTKMTMTQGRNYKNSYEVEQQRIETIRQLKREGKYDWRQLHTYRMPEVQADVEAPEEEAEEEWDGEITFGKRRPGGVQTRTRWNYASPT